MHVEHMLGRIDAEGTCSGLDDSLRQALGRIRAKARFAGKRSKLVLFQEQTCVFTEESSLFIMCLVGTKFCEADSLTGGIHMI